ncbi:MAG: hypothetical protein G8237_08050 [Magnetococcales bacterium]|nr:hypothetical protein [Magnetococcales bacterium]
MLPANGFGRSDTCSGCMKDTRVCLNCRFHDAGSYNECRESVAERIVDKEKSNFCDHFMSKGAMPRNENHRMGGRSNGSGKGNANGTTSGKSRNAEGGTANSAAWAAAEALFKRN